MQCRDGENAPYELTRRGDLGALVEWYAVKEYELPFYAGQVFLRIDFRYDSWGSEEETAVFSYSLDGEQYCRLGMELALVYSLSVFVGARIGIFSYNEEREDGGTADFKDFVAEFE